MEIDLPKLLSEPWAYESLEPLSQEDVVLQLFRLPSFEPRASWTIFGSDGDRFRVRRLQAPLGQRVWPPFVFGSEGWVRQEQVEVLLGEVIDIGVPDDSRGAVSVDGIGWVIRYAAIPRFENLAWRELSEVCDLSLWSGRVAETLDAHLPAYSDPGGQA